jgi:hypothetical protein
MISFMEEGIHSLFNVNFDLIGCKCQILDLHLILGHVDIEGFDVGANVPDLLLQVVLLMVEFDEVIPLDISHQALNASFE